MTVDELLGKLNAAFPAFNARALEAWGSVFRDVCGRHEGPALKSAYTAVLSSFTVAKSKALHPVPADFAEHLPKGHPKIPSTGPALDIKGHGDRRRQLLASWRAAQGRRAANSVPEVMQALEFVAGQVAGILAWNANPEPLLLTRAQVRLAQHRAISLQRRVEFGQLPKSNEDWWEQISAIAARWGIATLYEEWAPKKPQKVAA